MGLAFMLDIIFTPKNWYWRVGGNSSRFWSSAVGGYIPAQQLPDGAHFTAIASEVELAEVLRPYGLAVPTANADDVRKECARRMRVFLGTRDDEHTAIVLSNASREAIALNDQKLSFLAGDAGATDWTAEQTAQSNRLRGANTAIDAIRAASNAIEPNPPVDYKNDLYWPPFTQGF